MPNHISGRPFSGEAMLRYLFSHDNGCLAHPDCDTCPFAVCWLEDGSVLKKQAEEAWRGEVARTVRISGVAEAAQVYGVSARTVKRALAAVATNQRHS